VEVSGWDSNEDFFVLTELHWSEESGKHIELRRPIETGAIYFAAARSVPYVAERMGSAESGPNRRRLVVAKPKGRAN